MEQGGLGAPWPPSEPKSGKGASVGGVVTALVLGVLVLRLAGGIDPPASSRAAAVNREMARVLEEAVAEGEVTSAPTAGLGDATALMGVYREHVDRSLQIGRDYQMRLQTLRTDNILLPTRLDSLEEIADSRERLGKAADALANAKSTMATLMQQTRGRLEKAAPGKAEALEVLAGFDAGMKDTRPAQDRMYFLEEAALESIGSLLDVCEEGVGRNVVRGGRLLFAEDDDLLRFNLEAARLAEIGHRQAVLQEAMFDDVKQSAESLRVGNAGPGARLVERRTSQRIEVGLAGLRFNGGEIGVPHTLADTQKAFGRPDRSTTTPEGIVHCWEGVGIVAGLMPGSERVGWLTVTTNVFDETSDLEPRAPFRGTVRLLGEEVTDIDNPVSLNRRLEGARFKPLDGDGALWTIDGEGCSLVMSVADNGMTNGLTIWPVQAAEPHASKPRF